MTQRFQSNPKNWRLAAALATLLLVAGCSESAMRLQSSDSLEAALADIQLVRDVTAPFGGHPVQAEDVALVGNLSGTGGDAPPSAYRTLLLTQMQKHNVEKPSQVLASPATGMVIVRGQLPPGIQKGDRFDVEVFVPQDNTNTTSLRNGIMYQARLKEHALLGGRLREGKVIALAKGPILVDPLADHESQPAKLRRGLILGGGVALESRPLGLLIRPEHKDVRLSAQIGAVINSRFYLTRRGIKSGIAKPKTDGYIELTLHPRYKDNIQRFMQVVRSVPLAETASQRQMRLRLLERQLMDPITAASAAVRLEAIGPEAKDVLKQGIASSNPEIQFYAAEALAYLDDAAAAAPLAAAARNEPAFRAPALTALGAMDEPAARDELVLLLNVPSAETRYGAFRALWAMNERDPLVRGEMLGEQFSYHRVGSQGPPMIHITRSFRPEIVIFGADQPLKTPLILDAGKYLHVNATATGTITITKIVPGQPEKQIETSLTVDKMIRAIVELGGSYPDVVQVLAQAKETQSVGCRLEVDAIPQRGRTYAREDTHLAQFGGNREISAVGPSADLQAASGHNTGEVSRVEDLKQAKPTAVELTRDDDKIEDNTAKFRSGWPLSRHAGRIIDRFRK